MRIFFFFPSHYLYTFFFFPNFLEIFPHVFVPFRLFISFSYVIFPIIIRSAYIGFVKLEWNYWKIKIFGRCLRSLFFFFYFKDQDEFYTRWIVLKWNKFVIDKKKKAIMLEERRKWETLIVIKLVLRNWLVY